MNSADIPPHAEEVVSFMLDRQVCSVEQAYAVIRFLLVRDPGMRDATVREWKRQFYWCSADIDRRRNRPSNLGYWRIRARPSHGAESRLGFDVTRAAKVRGAKWRTPIMGGRS